MVTQNHYLSRIHTMQCKEVLCCFVNWMLEKNSHTLYSLEQKKKVNITIEELKQLALIGELHDLTHRLSTLEGCQVYDTKVNQ